MNFLIKNPNLTKKNLMGERGGDGGVARVSDFFVVFFFQKNPSLKKNCSLFEGVKVREDWLVKVNLFYKESKSKKIIFVTKNPNL